MLSSYRSKVLPALFAVACALPQAVAQAEPTRIDFTGHVQVVDTAHFPGVAVGAPVSGWVIYESVSSGSSVASGSPYGFSFDYAGTVVSQSGGVVQFVANDLCFSVAADCVRFGLGYNTLNFLDFAKQTLSNDTMPSAAVLMGFPTIYLLDDTGGAMRLYAPIDQIDITPVPEPAGVALMLAGLGIVGWAARRGRQG